MEPEGSLPHSQEPATCPYLQLYQRISPGPRLCIVFRNMVIFYGEELLAPRPTPKLEGAFFLYKIFIYYISSTFQ
jgi:hypothetical protein